MKRVFGAGAVLGLLLIAYKGTRVHSKYCAIVQLLKFNAPQERDFDFSKIFL